MFAVLDEFRSMGIRLEITEAGPKYEAAKGVVTQEVLGRLKENRERVIQALKAEADECWLGRCYRCQCGSGRLKVFDDAVHCESCKSAAYKFVGSSLIRCDLVTSKCTGGV